MAITALEYLVFSELRSQGLLPANPRVLELGESNWYDDVPVNQLIADIRRFIADPALRDRLIAGLEECAQSNRESRYYEIARIWLQTFLHPSDYRTIDPGTPASTYRFDLNQPVPIDEQFDITLNFGTAEHVFNIYQFFKTAHERTADGGMMVHTSPFTGWLEHGFYNFQPTFFYDLADANGYQVISVVCARLGLGTFECIQIGSRHDLPGLIRAGKIPVNGNLNVVLRKAVQPTEFKIPVQGYYRGALSEEGMRAWREMR